ncbi:glycosyltransferase family 2 protein [Escherichia coli]|jgi:dTDP-glucose pyrophosphorylase|uniref:Capsular biosynthesis protein n=8 Tax=Escherichia coli TaxID=562 RepID=A0A7A5DSC7_ECOLX|nr:MULTISPECIES: glycosyltransferase family 2 protein [Enterobacteriaceae]EEY8306194.1 capsular biosynthesis protein [Escherichia coli]EFF0489066.1 capsular biosynthesis protein [Escherichia coli]EFF2201319.1 capsular biosynthesis protein [Escherichia coli]EFF9871491.1 capsular biosynthesis protein [Escherichia coli]EFH8636937.1 capsular biosynthesis protein [Escherichia coli]
MIIIPMAGMSSRFFKAGYSKPKYMLELNGEFLFDLCLKSFKLYFETEHFVFILRDVFNTKSFVLQRIASLGINSYTLITLDKETRGQAETVYLAISKLFNIEQPITIFNIDTIRPNFIFTKFEGENECYIEVFRGDGDNWSFVMPSNDVKNEVIATSEKKQISNLCCTGLYHFSTIKNFISAYEHYKNLPQENWDAGELYIAPIYNYLISNGIKVYYTEINKSDVIFCGTPREYENLQGKK